MLTYLEIIYFSIFNKSNVKVTFLNILKHGNISAVVKKIYRCFKVSYRPVNILPIIFKVFEKLLSKQIPNLLIVFVEISKWF